MKRRDDFSWHSSNSYYCEEHRKLRETYWKIVRNYDTNPESFSSSYDGQLTNDDDDDDVASSNRRRGIVEQNRDSPVASCLKTVGSRTEKSEAEKRVNFHEEKDETTSYSSSSYYRLPQNNNYSRRPSSHRSTANRDDDSSLYNSINSISDLYDPQCSGTRSAGHPRAGTTPSRKSSKTDDSSNEKRRLLERLSGLSLHSSSSSVTCCSSRKKPEPRLYKPKDCLKRAAVRRMLVYPPEGQTGPPLTLRRSWSNIDCRVSGDPSNGYRYKVYYLQKFESDGWFPDDKTGSPFRRLEDDCSTDYG